MIAKQLFLGFLCVASSVAHQLSEHYPIRTISENKTLCQACEEAMKQLEYLIIGDADDSVIDDQIKGMCSRYLKYSDTICHTTAMIFRDVFKYIVKFSPHKPLTPKRACSIYMEEHGCKDDSYVPWEIPLPPLPKKEESPSKSNSAEEKVTILQLTDLHTDYAYTNGSNAACGQALCCQSEIPSTAENAAGYWGDYHKCDVPEWTIHSLIQNVADKHLDDIDDIYFTGDVISHDYWHKTIEHTVGDIRTWYDLLSTTFKGKSVYPVLGNHDSHPVHFYGPAVGDTNSKKFSMEWLFNLVAEIWSQWLPDEAVATIKKGGYYSVKSKHGYRIITLNSNVCYTNNAWLIFDDKDQYGQLAWLVEELVKAEKNKEKVHILSHVPPGEIFCHRQWSNQYRKIVERFSDTIAAQFNGHTHVDEIRLFPNRKNSSQIINVAYNGGSITTFVGLNSNYKIYQAEATTGIVQNYDEYILNITKANADTSVANWSKHYSFKEAYGLQDMSLESLGQFVRKLSQDTSLLYQYFTNSVKGSDALIKDGCNEKCLKSLLCTITAVETDEALLC